MRDHDLHSMLIEWGNWRMCRSSRDVEKSKADVRGEFCSRPPPGVWMTPAWKVREFRDISSVYERLPDFQRRVIRRIYLDAIPEKQLPTVLGVAKREVNAYHKKALEMIDSGLKILDEAHRMRAA